MISFGGRGAIAHVCQHVAPPVAGVDVVALILAATARGSPHPWRGDLWQAAKYTLSSPLSCDNLLDACLPPVYTLLNININIFKLYI